MPKVTTIQIRGNKYEISDDIRGADHRADERPDDQSGDRPWQRGDRLGE